MLLIIRGAPGSGKTTLAEKMAAAFLSRGIPASHIEADHWFMQNGEYKFDARQLADAHAWCLDQAEKELMGERIVIVSNTFTRIWEVNPYLTLSIRHNCHAFVLRCKGNWQNIHGVPETKVRQMIENYQPIMGEIDAEAA